MFKAVRLKQDGDPYESWQRHVQSLQMFFCVRVMDQGQPVLNGARFEQDFLHLSPNISLRYHAAVRSKGQIQELKSAAPWWHTISVHA